MEMSGSPLQPLARRLCGSQNRSGRGGKDKCYQSFPGFEPRSSNP